MNLSHFNSFLDYQSVSTGTVLAYYDFENYSGQYLRNELYTGMLSDGCVDASKYPGLISCINTGDFFSSNGSGYFDGEATLQIGSGIDLSEFTIFLNFNYSSQTTGKPQVLLSSVGSGVSNSGFYVYVNDANRLSVEYPKGGLPFSNTINKELGEKNIISLGKNSSSTSFDLIYHDIVDKENSVIYFKPTSFINSNTLTFGNVNFNEPSLTGLSGHVDNIVILNSYLPATKRNEIAKSFVSTGLDFNSFTVTSENVNTIESVTFENQATGTGITGYTSIGTKNIDLKCGSPIQICDLSGVTGELSGFAVTAINSADVITLSSSTLTAVSVAYDNDYMKQFGSNNVLLTPAYTLDSEDTYDLYTHNTFDSRKNNTPVYVKSLDVFRLDLDYVGQDINFYYNGLLQHSGSSSDGIVSNDYSLENDRDIDSDTFFTNNNSIIYDKISGSSFYSGFTTEDQSAIIMEIVGEDLTTKDVFYNGHKLVSGLDYREHPMFGNDTVELFLSGRATGYVYFYPKYSGVKQETGNCSSRIISTSEKITTSQLWLNGVRQLKNTDYSVLRSDSPILTENEFENFSFIIYNNYNNFFDT